MPFPHRVSLALREGFLDDHVRILAGEREVAAFDHLSTRVQIGLAETLDLDLAPGEDRLIVLLPDKDMRAEIALDQSAGRYIGVSITRDGKNIEARVSKTPRGYA